MTTMQTGLDRAIRDSGLSDSSGLRLVEAFGPFWSQAVPVVDEAAAVSVTDATQVSEMKHARALRLKLRAIRVEAENKRKELKEDSLKTGKAIDNVNKALLMLIEPAEQRLEEAERFAERAEAARKTALKASREALIGPYGVDTAYVDLGNMPEPTFAAMLEQAKTAHEARIAAARKAEEDRIAAEKARVAEEARIRAENERLRVEREAADRAAKAERDAREKAERDAAEAAHKARVAAEAEAARIKAEADAEAARVKAAADAKARKEREEAARKIAEERAAREKAEAEIAARRAEEEARAKAEAEAKRKAELAPDRDKLLGVAAAVLAIRVPAVGPEAAAVAAEIEQKVASFAAWIQSKVKGL